MLPVLKSYGKCAPKDAALGRRYPRIGLIVKRFIIPKPSIWELLVDTVPSAPGIRLMCCTKSNVLGAHFLTEDVSLFDASFFNFSAEVASVSDQKHSLDNL